MADLTTGFWSGDAWITDDCNDAFRRRISLNRSCIVSVCVRQDGTFEVAMTISGIWYLKENPIKAHGGREVVIQAVRRGAA